MAKFKRMKINLLRKFLEKSEESNSSLINMGCYFLKSELVQSIPDGVVSLERDVFEKLQSQRKLKGIPIKSYFIDIGIPEDYERFKNHSAKGFQL